MERTKSETAAGEISLKDAMLRAEIAKDRLSWPHLTYVWQCIKRQHTSCTKQIRFGGDRIPSSIVVSTIVKQPEYANKYRFWVVKPLKATGIPHVDRVQ